MKRIKKVSIDLRPGLVKEVEYLEVFKGCARTLDMLKIAAHLIEAFKVTWGDAGNGSYGPTIRVYIVDPFSGTKIPHETCYRHIGRGVHNPTSEEITDRLYSDLSERIVEIILISAKKAGELESLVDKIRKDVDKRSAKGKG